MEKQSEAPICSADGCTNKVLPSKHRRRGYWNKYCSRNCYYNSGRRKEYCTRCGLPKTAEGTQLNKRGQRVPRWRCRPCDSLNRWKQRHGIDLKGVERASHCEACGEEFNKSRKRVMDHDHDTDEFRGWLCNNCNSGLGMLKDDPAIVRKLLEYIEARS